MKDDEQYIYWEDLTNEDKEKSINHIKQIQLDLNKKFRDKGRVTLREVFESIGIPYKDTKFAKCDETKLGRWQYGGKESGLHFEEINVED